MKNREFREIHDREMQKVINDEINQDGIYEAYVQVVTIDRDYSRALDLNKEMFRRVSKICSESEGNRKKQAGLRLELLEKTAEDIQLTISKPDYN